MTLDESLRGHPVSLTEARRELEAHGIDTRNTPDRSGCVEARCLYGDGSWEWVQIPLNSRAILEWLGY